MESKSGCDSIIFRRVDLGMLREVCRKCSFDGRFGGGNGKVRKKRRVCKGVKERVEDNERRRD